MSITSSIWTGVRYLVSTALLIFGLGVILRAIILKRTLFWSSVPWGVCLALFFVLIIVLGALEGLQVAIVELAKIPAKSYHRSHPRAYRIARISQRLDALAHFLMGRQLLVVMIVFFLARLCTFHDPLFPAWLNKSLFNTGLFGAMIVVLIGNLPAQIYAADYGNALRFNSIPGMHFVLYACLLIEWTGITHAALLLPWIYTKMENLYLRICCAHRSSTRGLEDGPSDEWSALRTDPERVYLLPFPKTVPKLVPHSQEEALQIATFANYFSKWKLARVVRSQQEGPVITPFTASTEDFYNHPSSVGEIEYASPGEISTHLASTGLQTPRFLLPVNDPCHIPPHIVACRLLATIDLILQVEHLQRENATAPHLTPEGQ